MQASSTENETNLGDISPSRHRTIKSNIHSQIFGFSSVGNTPLITPNTSFIVDKKKTKDLDKS